MRQLTNQLSVSTRGKGFYEVTRSIEEWVRASGLDTGLLTVFIRHTSASLTIQENADPDVVRDMNAFLDRIAPEDNRLYVHTAEGPDDMPAHIRSALTATQLSIPLIGCRLALGTWQGVYVIEHRRSPHLRNVALHLLGE